MNATVQHGSPRSSGPQDHSKVVVITGASSGIGAAAAVELSSRGHAVALVARRAQALEEVAQRCRGQARAFVADVTRRADVDRAAGEILGGFGRIDVWINNAGQGISRMPSELTDDDIDSMMLINVKSVLYGCQAVLPHFRERGEGHIITVSSMLGRIPYATIRSAYCGAKHFVNALTGTLRDELRQTHPGIQISLVSPGVVYTDFGANAMHGGPDSRQLPEGQSAEEVGTVIADVVDSRAADVYTRAGYHQRVVDYFHSAGSDPDGAS